MDNLHYKHAYFLYIDNFLAILKGWLVATIKVNLIFQPLHHNRFLRGFQVLGVFGHTRCHANLELALSLAETVLIYFWLVGPHFISCDQWFKVLECLEHILRDGNYSPVVLGGIKDYTQRV